ncbi:hypothetical protein U2T78_002907 [Providencia stuartii]|uniref:IdsE2 n=1 Tax=Providencia stuartii TaxID=588 RepID=A0AAJ1JE15_PROST|nr:MULTISPECIES: hypothetical protein [Providencia]EMA3642164.1 hypothetical protein [Providencia stuartii]MBW3101885.1 hypothetical protein [Providencia stuartii]MCB5217561.1 hypothetical protein [Providencia stuartii]MDE8749551.1 hypothetical protein [Providencia thailandensis]MDE8769354.1 hypothetical protein [Providencia thailandensis]
MSNPFTVSKHPEQLKTRRLMEQSPHYDDPLPPKDLVFLQSMDEQDCVIKSAQINSRLSNTLPVFIVVLVMTFYTLFAFFEGHIAQKKAFQHDIKGVEEFHAGYMGNNKVVLSDIKQYEPFFGQEKISWWEYIKAYYSGQFFAGSENDKYLVIGWLIFFPGLLYIFGLLSFFVPLTWLVADRKRGILYSYVNDIVMATRYEDAQFGYAGKMLVFKLYYLHPETGELLTHIFKPNISHYTGFLMSSDTENHRFITFLNAYMQEGRSAVAETNYQRRQPWFCFAKNLRPADFKQQVEQILANLDKDNISHI